MHRRAFVKTAGLTGLGTLSGVHRLFAADAEVQLSPKEPGATISPHIYGHFIEHLGGVIYDGIWVGEDSKISNVGGIRKQFADDLKRIAAPNLRWPGGCFADQYHWRDGIGPVAKRPRTATYWGQRLPPKLKGAEPNWFGTHEFMRLCRLTGATPYLAANFTTGTPKEFHDWITYCNAPAGEVTLADERAANGDTQPFNVEYWGIGNEVWGCGGNMRPAEYVTLLRPFLSQIPRYGRPYLVLCGPRGHSEGRDVSWTAGLCEAMRGHRGGRLPPGLAMHFYTDFRPTKVNAARSTPEEWYSVLWEGAQVEEAIEQNWAVLSKYDPSHRTRFIIDEWGVWYSGSPEIAPGFNLGQVVTLRDAVHTSMHFDIFNRHADKIHMANVAQTINCLHSLFLAFEDSYVRTPVFHVFDMYKPHMGANLIPVKVRVPDIKVPVREGAGTLPGISVSASIRGKHVNVTLTNPSINEDVNVRLTGIDTTEARGMILTHNEIDATNTFKTPDAVAPVAMPVTTGQRAVTVRLPAKAVVALEFVIT